jgi:DNA polymerase-3 subunit chi
MTRVEFYSSSDKKLVVACRLAADAVRNKSRVVIYAPDEEAARSFNRMLWTYQAVEFVPHCMAQHPLAQETPVVITGKDADIPHYEVILNLHSDPPPTFSRFERLIELVGDGEDERQLARTRFRLYRERGYGISHHELPSTSA